MDPFMLVGLTDYGGKPLKNIDEAELELLKNEVWCHSRPLLNRFSATR